MPYFFSEYITNEKNAGNKARKDVEAIFSARGYKKVNYARAVDKNIVLRKIKNFVFLKRSLKKIPKEDILFIQYPFMSGGNTLLPYILSLIPAIRKLSLPSDKIICLSFLFP